MENPFHKVMVRRRTELKITQAEAARRAGCSRTTWNAWEDVNEFPRMENWKAIAAALEMRIEDFEQAGAMSWFIQTGPSPLQIAALEAAGKPLDGELPPHQFVNEGLRALDAAIELDIDRIGFAWWGKELALVRGHIRRLLIVQDAAFQAIQQLVETFRAMYLAMVSKPNQPPPKKTTKTTKVRKKKVSATAKPPVPAPLRRR